MPTTEMRDTASSPSAYRPLTTKSGEAPYSTLGFLLLNEKEGIVVSARLKSDRRLEAIFAATIAFGAAFAPVPSISLPFEQAETFGSRFQDAPSIMAREARARQLRRVFLLNKRRLASLNSIEAQELEHLQTVESGQLAIELQPAIDRLMQLLQA